MSAYVHAFKSSFCFVISLLTRLFSFAPGEKSMSLLQDLDTQSHQYGSKWLSGANKSTVFSSTVRPRNC